MTTLMKVFSYTFMISFGFFNLFSHMIVLNTQIFNLIVKFDLIKIYYYYN